MTVPVKCPICEGRGKVNPQFYPGDTGDDWKECRACKGNGVVWGIDNAPAIPMPQTIPVPYPYPVPHPVYPQPMPWIVTGPLKVWSGTVPSISTGVITSLGATVTYSADSTSAPND